jgi:putative transposase
MKQQDFYKSNGDHRYAYGGTYRNKRAGRKARPLSTKDSLHLVFKANRERLKAGFRSYKTFPLVHYLLAKYARKFFVKVEQVSIQGNHIHFHIRTTRRSNYQNFFRVLAGQIAQVFEREGFLAVEPVTGTPRSDQVTGTPKPGREKRKGLWMHRPFTRVVRGRKHEETLRDYIQLNEQEALGNIRYQKDRLRGLSDDEWERLWSERGVG